MTYPLRCCAFVVLASNALAEVFYEDGGYFYAPLPPAFPAYIPSLPPVVVSDETPVHSLPPLNEASIPHSDDSITIPSAPPQIPLANQNTQFRVENMSCIQGVNFRATFRLLNDFPQFPVVDDAMETCLFSMGSNRFIIDLENYNSMVKCGVKRCKSGENMCVMLRIPMVRGVRLPEDGVVTLMCTPQEKVVSQTKHLKLGTNKITQTSRARSNSGFLAVGGTQKDLKTKIGVFRRPLGSNAFDQAVQMDSTIQLGEELVLRAIVNDGDGWKGSQIGPVLITGLNSKKSALLVNQQGCVNPAMKSICPKPPLKVNALMTELRFRAFLFQESPQGDEMVVSVRTQGCWHAQDCARAESCNDDDPTVRSKRDAFYGENTENSIVEELQLTFKVKPLVIMEKETRFLKDDKVDKLVFLYFSLVGAVLAVFALILLVWRNYCR